MSNYSKIQQKIHRSKNRKAFLGSKNARNARSMPNMDQMDDQNQITHLNIKAIEPGKTYEKNTSKRFISHQNNTNFAKPVPKLIQIKKSEYELMNQSQNRKIKGRIWGLRSLSHQELLDKRKELHRKLHQPKRMAIKFAKRFAAEVKDEEFERFKDMLMVDTIEGESRYKSGFRSRTMSYSKDFTVYGGSFKGGF